MYMSSSLHLVRRLDEMAGSCSKIKTKYMFDHTFFHYMSLFFSISELFFYPKLIGFSS